MMEYKYSILLSKNEYHVDGLCDGLPVRKHLAAELEEIGAFRAQADWSRLVGPVKSYKGGLGPRHSFMALSLPECLPDRLLIVSYANEFAFLHDDDTEGSNKIRSDTENNNLAEAFKEGTSKGNIDPTGSGKRQIQAKILNRMMSIDRQRALVAMKAWAAFAQEGSGRQQHKRFSSLDAYLPYRALDVGQMFWFALVTFGCALTVPENEIQLCNELALPAVNAASLTNDLFSFEKEMEAAHVAGHSYISNAICILMIEHGVSLEEAKNLCKVRIKEEVAIYMRTLDGLKRRSDLAEDSKKYLELLQYSVSGNVVWSMECPRYHKAAVYNQHQLQLQDEIVNNDPNPNRFLAYENGTGLSHFQHRRASQRSMRDPDAEGTNIHSDRLHILETVQGRHDTLGKTAKIATATATPSLSNEPVLEPYKYLSSLPSKGIRDRAIDALNCWLNLPNTYIVTVKEIITILHNASLMLDDIQDHSELRRGAPSTHMIFGEAQTINSATYQYVEVISILRKLDNSHALDIFVKEAKALFVGQSYELLWTRGQECPSFAQYFAMIDGKTGAIFRMLAKLMMVKSFEHDQIGLDRICCLFGRYFQVRDDYQNLASEEYKNQKGLCEDLDEGKYSLPLIHALKQTKTGRQVKELLSQRHLQGRLTGSQKQLLLRLIQEAGSLDFTLKILQSIGHDLQAEIERLEAQFGKANYELRLILEMLKV